MLFIYMLDIYYWKDLDNLIGQPNMLVLKICIHWKKDEKIYVLITLSLRQLYEDCLKPKKVEEAE